MFCHFSISVIMDKSKRGKLQVILGPMFSGKTSELIRRMTRYTYAGYRCIVILHARDGLRDCAVRTHDGRELPAVAASSLSQLSQMYQEYDVIGIDEGQFFDDIAVWCDTLSNAGKKVIVAGLDGSDKREGFKNMLNLICLAESVVKLTAVCMSCSNEASFTKRVENGTAQSLGKYMAVCGRCFDLASPSCSSPFKRLSTSKYVNPLQCSPFKMDIANAVHAAI